jgi:hypothetical protein
MLPHDVCPRSVIDKPQCARLKLYSQLHQTKLPKSGESSRPGGSNIRPPSCAHPGCDSPSTPRDPGLAIGHRVDLSRQAARLCRRPKENGATIWSMALAETQQLRMLERLRRTGKEPVTLGELRHAGVDFPAVALSELELNGYAIERVYEHHRLIGVRLLRTEAPETPSSRRLHRWRRASRWAQCPHQGRSSVHADWPNMARSAAARWSARRRCCPASSERPTGTRRAAPT